MRRRQICRMIQDRLSNICPDLHQDVALGTRVDLCPSKACDHPEKSFACRNYAERKIFFHCMGIDICSEHPVPDGEDKAEVHVGEAPGPVMNAVIIGRDEQPFKAAEVDAEIRMYPDVDNNSH